MAEWKDLSYLEGTELTLVAGVISNYKEPHEIFFVKDYPNYCLIDTVFYGSEWGVDLPPRHIYRDIPKAKMFCGDLILKSVYGVMLAGREIKEQTFNIDKELK